LGGPLQMFSAKINSNTMTQLEESGIQLRDGFKEEYAAAGMMYGIIAMILAVILLVGGILLLKRKKRGAPILQLWAVLKLTGGVFATIKFSMINNEFTQKTMEQAFGATGSGGKEAEMMGSVMGIAAKVGMVFGVLWLAALPVILLIFLNRAKAKQEMATW